MIEIYLQAAVAVHQQEMPEGVDIQFLIKLQKLGLAQLVSLKIEQTQHRTAATVLQHKDLVPRKGHIGDIAATFCPVEVRMETSEQAKQHYDDQISFHGNKNIESFIKKMVLDGQLQIYLEKKHT